MIKDKVQILLSSYNGVRFLKAQLDSLIEQENDNIDLKVLIRDDGSFDGTQNILNSYQEMTNGKISWFQGVNLKPAMSFLELIRLADLGCDYFAFCDQDDVWISNKIQIAVNSLHNLDKPALYYCGVEKVDSDLHHLGYGFRNHSLTGNLKSSLQSLGDISGCTIVINRQLLTTLRKYYPTNIVMHDYWIHKVCLAVKGFIIADPDSLIKYRIHTNNVTGKVSCFKRIKRLIKMMIQNNGCKYSHTIQELIIGYGKQMDSHELSTAKIFANYKDNYVDRMRLLFEKMPPELAFNEKIEFRLKVLFGVF